MLKESNVSLIIWIIYLRSWKRRHTVNVKTETQCEPTRFFHDKVSVTHVILIMLKWFNIDKLDYVATYQFHCNCSVLAERSRPHTLLIGCDFWLTLSISQKLMRNVWVYVEISQTLVSLKIWDTFSFETPFCQDNSYTTILQLFYAVLWNFSDNFCCLITTLSQMFL